MPKFHDRPPQTKGPQRRRAVGEPATRRTHPGKPRGIIREIPVLPLETTESGPWSVPLLWITPTSAPPLAAPLTPPLAPREWRGA